MKHLSLQQLADTIGYSNYTFSLEIDKEDKNYFFIEDVVGDLIHWSCGEYEECLKTYINHFDNDGNYIDSYNILPTPEEAEELRMCCKNWIEVFG